jgi:hypothetical protein
MHRHSSKVSCMQLMCHYNIVLYILHMVFVMLGLYIISWVSFCCHGIASNSVDWTQHLRMEAESSFQNVILIKFGGWLMSIKPIIILTLTPNEGEWSASLCRSCYILRPQTRWCCHSACNDEEDNHSSCLASKSTVQHLPTNSYHPFSCVIFLMFFELPVL